MAQTCILHYLISEKNHINRAEPGAVWSGRVGDLSGRTRIGAGQEANGRPRQFQTQCCNHHCCRKFESDANHQPVWSLRGPSQRPPESPHSSAFLAPPRWQRRPILGRFLRFLQKVSEGHFRRQHHHVVGVRVLFASAVPIADFPRAASVRFRGMSEHRGLEISGLLLAHSGIAACCG